ncbi:hypothetical protein Tco_0524338 [Tanacetum coccineum]
MDDFMYGITDEDEWADIPGIRWDFLRELTCGIPEMHQVEDWQGPRERNIDEYWWRIYKSGDLKVLES